MTEDELYRKSSQYRFWNFAPEKLDALRQETNEFAVQQVKHAIRRQRDRENANGGANSESNGENNGLANSTGRVDEIECLTTAEEKIIVDVYCAQCLKAGSDQPFSLPITVVATAVQYLKRFYLSNSPMNYHPKQIFPAALFLATKTETIHLTIPVFVEKLKTLGGFKKITTQEVLAPEFLITQALRFCFDVRHPQRAIKGVYMELLLLNQCVSGTLKALPWAGRDMKTLLAELLRLPKASQGQIKQGIMASQRETQAMLPRDFEKRVEHAHGKARDITRKEALLSDAYFFFTPSQICFAAYWMADRPLTEYYLSCKLGLPWQASSGGGVIVDSASPKKAGILTSIKACAALLAEQSKELYETAGEVDKKLKRARNPEKRDLVGLNAAQKRDAGGDGKLDENVAKKRRTEREKANREVDDIFGPPLVTRDGPSKP